MKIKGVTSKDYSCEISNCGREGIKIEVEDRLGSMISVVVDKKEFFKLLEDLK